jgi:hypothetical protein
MKIEQKVYTGVKRIFATPMNRKEYIDYRGWELPANENGADDGYLVEYEQSQTSINVNHPKHKGYISWSPKDVFEESYINTNVFLDNGKPFDEYEPHQQRVINELKDLTKKTFDLGSFLQTDFFKQNVDIHEQTRLKQQLIVMQTYESLLIDRINNFN